MGQNIDKKGYYVVPGDWLFGLQKLGKWLYEDAFSDAEKHPNNFRDWASWLDQGFFTNIEKIQDV